MKAKRATINDSNTFGVPVEFRVTYLPMTDGAIVAFMLLSPPWQSEEVVYRIKGYTPELNEPILRDASYEWIKKVLGVDPSTIGSSFFEGILHRLSNEPVLPLEERRKLAQRYRVEEFKVL